MAAATGAFDVWIEEKKAERVRLELIRRETLGRLVAWLDRSAGAFGVSEAFIFGSVTEPYRFGPNSDVDLALERPDRTFHAQFATQLERELDRDVDLLYLSECRFSAAITTEGVHWTRSESAS